MFFIDKKLLYRSCLENSAFMEKKALKNSNKRGINLNWFIPFLFLAFSFSVQANSAQFKQECEKDAISKGFHNPQDPVQYTERKSFINYCIAEKKREAEKKKKIIQYAIDCSQKLLKEKYDIRVEIVEDFDEDSGESRDRDHVMITGLKETCATAKQATEKCCSNPNACNGFGRDLIQHVLPLTPALYGAYKSYKISKSANKGELTHEEAVNKMCHASNKIAVGAFGASLLSQLMPMFQKTCGKKIKKCKETCNSSINKFKEDFKQCYSKLFPKQNQNIYSMILSAKECFDFDDLGDESFDTKIDNKYYMADKVLENGSDFKGDYTKRRIAERKNQCVFDLSVGFKKDNQATKTKEQTIVLSELLYIAKAYMKTTLKGTRLLSDKSNEKEIIDCHDQPDRVLDSSYQAGSPISPPAIQICKQAMDYVVNKEPPKETKETTTTSPSMPNGPGNQASNVSPISNFAGNDSGPGGVNPLQVPSNDECYGDLDAEALEKCIPDPGGEDDIPPPPRPGLAKNLPGFKPKGSGGSSGSGGGGPGGGGLGSSAGNESNRNGSMYPPYSGDMSSSPGFSDGDFESASYGDGGTNDPAYRELAENSDDDTGLGDDEMPFGEDEDLGGGKSIFQLASERIQTFCSDHSCDK